MPGGDNSTSTELQDPLLERFNDEDRTTDKDDAVKDKDKDKDKEAEVPLSPTDTKEWTLKVEIGKILGISLPIALSTVARLAINFTDTAFVGHLGTACLSGASLALNWSGILNDFM
mgnify:CR=1 FL=1